MSQFDSYTRRGLLGAAFILLSACTILPETEPLTIYQLPPPSQETGVSQLSLPTLRINTPQAGFAQSGPRILVNPEGDQLSTYKGARWTDPAPVLVREHLARAFRYRVSPTQISTDEQALHAEVHLGSDLRSFQVVYGAAGPVAVIDLDARLIQPKSREIIAARRFLIEQPLENVQVPYVVKAFKLASDELARQMINWTNESLASP